MAVYFLIAAPTQLWHHHDAVENAGDVTGNKTTVAKLPGSSIDKDCQVCSHQYSAYIDYTAILFAPPVFSQQSKEDFHYLSIPSAPAFNLINKGPPAILS